MRTTTPLVLLASASLVLAACGGDDDGGTAQLGSPFGSDTAPATISEDLADAIADGDPEAIEDAMGDLTEGLEDLISNFGGDGGGTITVDGVTYTVEADVCISGPTDFTLDGPATGSDGSSAWVSVNYSLSNRDDMAGFIDESVLDNMFPDGAQTMEDASVEVSVGQTSRFESVDDQPNWNAMAESTFAVGGTLEWERSGSSMSGRGEAQDYNFVSGDFNATVPLEFNVACS